MPAIWYHQVVHRENIRASSVRTVRSAIFQVTTGATNCAAQQGCQSCP
ncbi:MAG: hypothetical protein DSM106950_23450 [Stigonema ocellatum SAG 48.90 = DSM 106950]|nr:hypothetical protein [Stigonema ocellatum SAG 48.90 = DSM 106950]